MYAEVLQARGERGRHSKGGERRAGGDARRIRLSRPAARTPPTAAGPIALGIAISSTPTVIRAASDQAHRRVCNWLTYWVDDTIDWLSGDPVDLSTGLLTDSPTELAVDDALTPVDVTRTRGAARGVRTAAAGGGAGPWCAGTRRGERCVGGISRLKVALGR
ncbi:hypothetical protein [Streptomyces sp. NPDC002088]|uniref:hypothetical protein n=1 Tax=Streptomyces sp. NPDC002088 TaxID=3154665 RepID=UPI003329CA09